MAETTPFEISLVHELGQDVIRMANDWFFKWHSINIENRTVDVEDFYGGRITVGGIMFQGQIQEIYWSSVSGSTSSTGCTKASANGRPSVRPIR